MSIRMLCIAALAVLTIGRGSAFGDVTLKRKVIEDCPQALIEIQQLTPEQRKDFIPYLTLVLRLQTGQMPDLPLPPNSMDKDPTSGRPFFALDNADISRSFNPDREIKAKRCALEGLLLMVPDSLDALPEIIRLPNDPMVPTDVKDLADSAVRFISVKAAEQNVELNDDFIRRSITLFKERDTFHIENVFLELGPRTIPYLTEAFLGLEPSGREAIERVLLKIDANGDLIGPHLLALLSAGEDGVRMQALSLLGKLKGFYKESFGPIVALLQDVSPPVRERALKVLDEMLAKAPDEAWLKCSDESYSILLNSLRSAPLDFRPVLIRISSAVTPFVEHGERALLELYDSAQTDLRAGIVDILGGQSELGDDGFRLLMREMSSPEPSLQLRAVSAASRHDARKKEIVSAFSKLLKGNAALKDVERRQRMVFEVAKAVARLKPEASAAALVPYFISGLEFPQLSPAGGQVPQSEDLNSNYMMGALVAIGPEALAPLVKSFNHADPLVRRRIAYVLGRLTPTRSAAIDALIAHLKDADSRVVNECKSSLEMLGGVVAPYVTKLLKAKILDIRKSAAQVLGAIGKATTESDAIIISALESAVCADKPRMVQLIAHIPDESSVKVVHELLTCLYAPGAGAGDIVAALEHISPLPDNGKSELLGILKLNKLERSVEFEVIERAQKFDLDRAIVMERLLMLLQDAEGPVRFRAVRLAGKFGAEGKSLVPMLQKIVQDKPKEPPLRIEAAVALSKIDKESFNATNFFVEEFNSDRALWAGKIIRHLEPNEAVPILMEALNRADEERRPLIIRTLGELASQVPTVDVVGGILPALGSTNSEVHYQATVALVRNNSALSELVPALRRELVRRDSVRLLNEGFGVEVVPLVEEIVANPESRLETYNATQLLRSIPRAE